ncbi:serine/arginine repetitive matrix protein 4 [Bombina bombina]|uniref:serine/arginine repetitive matrix protein 4 n=1 Tax=Bombina bombina TaxID=8345 RepID=UPI00235AF51F|nr:serine/arginine repetitive matrix protein 4 [Bombina bombina]
MASVQQGEKQLFEKFWKGTSKAVATPRRESIIVTSITSRKPLPSNDLVSFLSYQDKENPCEKQNGKLADGYSLERFSRQLTPHQPHSHSEAEDVSISPPTKGKKKKKKSERKKRKRSRSYSPSPVKKKKKKSSKKHKRNRSSSKKRRHGSSSPKSKSKQERKHKKHSRGRPRKSHRHRHRHSRSESSESRSSSCENRLHGQSKDRHQSKRKKHRCNSRSVNKKQREDKPQYSPLSAQNSNIHCNKMAISQSVPGLLVTEKSHEGRKEGAHEYDSGNDTCSPPSMQASSSELKVSPDKDSPAHQGFEHAPSSEKTPNGHSDNISDSGNSSTSCFSFIKDTPHFVGDADKEEKRVLSPCLGCLEEQKNISEPSPDRYSQCRPRSRSTSYSSRRSYSYSSNHSISSYSSRHQSSSGRKSRCRSSSSRSYSHSPYSLKSGRKSPGSKNSRSRRSPSYSRYSPSRDHDRTCKYGSTDKETRKGSHRKRQSSYSPMRKRRRDSPSHLEARRITSARKRPIPYYRPSPSSSSSDSSTPSWYGTHSRSRSRSFSSHRSSRSRSPSSGRSRSRDCSRSSWEHSRSRSRSWSRNSDSSSSTRS